MLCTNVFNENKLLDIKDPQHCLSRLISGSKINIPEDVLKFQTKIQERQRIKHQQLLKIKLEKAHIEKKKIEEKMNSQTLEFK